MNSANLQQLLSHSALAANSQQGCRHRILGCCRWIVTMHCRMLDYVACMHRHMPMALRKLYAHCCTFCSPLHSQNFALHAYGPEETVCTLLHLLFPSADAELRLGSVFNTLPPTCMLRLLCCFLSQQHGLIELDQCQYESHGAAAFLLTHS
jgi:hypothetical protein